jgi:hypothetical protein
MRGSAASHDWHTSALAQGAAHKAQACGSSDAAESASRRMLSNNAARKFDIAIPTPHTPPTLFSMTARACSACAALGHHPNG